MYVLSRQIADLPIVSLQTGQAVARLGSPIVNPDSLELVAFFCTGSGWRRTKAVLMSKDIRQVSGDGAIIDSLEEIEDASEIVRLGAIIERNFNPIGVSVVNESGYKLGKVEDYTIDDRSFKIQKLYLKQSVIKNLLLNNLVIDRNQITDVTPKQITVRDATVKESLLAPQPATQK